MNNPSTLLNNRYQLIERLGIGGMAEVYRARDLMLERYVAIKILRDENASDPEFQERFRQEAKAAANLSHPNIVTVHDFGFDKGQLFIVMEYVPGKMLKEMIQALGRFTPEDAIPLMVQACAGIGYAHRAGLVHCDVKPHNMLVTPDMRLKVGDFGIARALASIHPDEHSEVVWGSPLYFSPEQAAGLAPTPASDVYSLGVVLYEMLAGKTPFIATRPEILAEMHRELIPRPLRDFNPAISPALEQIVLKTLAKEPSARYRTADQLGRVLLNFGNTHAAPALQLTPEAAPDIHPGAMATMQSTPPGTRPQSAPPGVSKPVSRPISQPKSKPMSYRTPEQVSVAFSPAESVDSDINIDWIAVLLGLLAMTAVLGLLPFWVYIFQLYNR
jgi:eukaryotic-like serine/threonine-protein kinase